MKNIKILLLLILSLSISCIDDDNDELTGDAIEGGLITLNSSNRAIGYVVGNNATYTATGTVYQGNTQTEKIEVYKSFTSSATNNTTNEVLLATLTIDNTSIGTNSSFSFSFTYEDLIADLVLNGDPLPTNDSSLNIGDFWTLRYVSSLSDNNIISNSTTTKIAVNTRFAGRYRTVDAAYYRIGVLTYVTADFQNFVPEQIIESVDATTYRVVEYFGVFPGNEWYFQIDAEDNITYPEKTPTGEDQNGNGAPFITCQSNPTDMVNVPCGTDTNIVIRDDVNGADRLVLSYGYYTSGSGPREFYQVLEKIVD